jgi:redox-sensitive bicupin YhaK (pirin superfamily)
VSLLLQTFPLGPQWPTLDPFLFVAHHHDDYPAGTDRLGPAAPLDGRSLGSDFSGRDGWSMYHGTVVPGFPQHPHRGFETVTFLRSGVVDHSDSLGATARFGAGDTQWMTAGAGIQHAEMFPLLDPQGANPLELFQIWLNLPAEHKMVDPYFTMLWSGGTPRVVVPDDGGRVTEVMVIAGRLGEPEPPAPPPHSWASNADAHVAIWHVSMAPRASWRLPPAPDPGVGRVLYAFDGSSVRCAGSDGSDGSDGSADEVVEAGNGAVLQPDRSLDLTAGPEGVECLVLQGRPIGEPVVSYGPFVMNSEREIEQAIDDYRRTQFGGWPWPGPAPDHGRDAGRFALHPDGRRELGR